MLSSQYLHCEIIQFWVESGEPPTIQWLLDRTREPLTEIVAALKNLEADQGAVVDSILYKNNSTDLLALLDRPSVVRMQPFCNQPCNFSIKTSNKKGPSFSACCAFCSLGSFMLIPEDTITVNSSQSDGRGKVLVQFSHQNEKISITPKEAIIHFPAPISNVLNDVRTGHDGIMFFKSPSHLSKWLSQQGSLQGRIIPVETGYKLAKMWFSSHHDINWKLWKPSEVKEMLSLVGLSNDSFWLN